MKRNRELDDHAHGILNLINERTLKIKTTNKENEIQ